MDNQLTREEVIRTIANSFWFIKGENLETFKSEAELILEFIEVEGWERNEPRIE